MKSTHDNSKRHEELERTDASYCGLRPSIMKKENDDDDMHRERGVVLKLFGLKIADGCSDHQKFRNMRIERFREFA